METRQGSESINILTVSGVLDARQSFTELHLQDGRTVRVPTAMLLGEPESRVDFNAGGGPVIVPEGEEQVVPIVEEHLTVGRRTVETGRVLLHKITQVFEQPLNESLAVRSFDVERVLLNQPVDVAPPVRQEGATTIYPLVEERLVLTKELVLREEIRVTRRDTVRRDTQVVQLRREQMEVERKSASPAVVSPRE